MVTRRSLMLAGVVLLLLLTLVPGAFARQGQTHTVQPGENLFRIALRYGIPVEDLAFANGITNPALIFVGQRLVIPTTGGTGPAPATPATAQAASTQIPPSTQASPESYTVQAGDTLFSIARRFGTTVSNLTSLNGITNADRIEVGQVLVIRRGGGTSPGTGNTGAEQPQTYTVQPGDTLRVIALRFGTTVAEIVQLNGISNADLIFAGQVLTVRRGSLGLPAATNTPIPVTASGATPTATIEGGGPITAPTNTPVPTVTPIPTAGPTQAATSDTASDVNSAVIPATAPNLLTNPGFEGETREIGFDEINVVNGWDGYYCDTPVTPEKCPAPRAGAGNPEGLTMGRPEFKATDVTARVHGGAQAQQWFCFWRTCQAGVSQTITTTPGAVCEIGAYVQSISSNRDSFSSELTTFGQRINSTWTMKVDLSGGNYAFTAGLPVSAGFGYEQGIYDQYVLITHRFRATGNTTTIFFENLRIWPFRHNDNFIDDAYIRCTG